MAFEFKLPSLGEGVDSADVLSVLVSEGDEIEAEQGVIELETDKATMEVPCPQAGKIQKIHVSEGDTIEEGALLVTLEGGDGQATEEKPELKEDEQEKAEQEESKQKEDQAKEKEKKRQQEEADQQAEDEAEEPEEQEEAPQRAQPATTSATPPPGQTVKAPAPVEDYDEEGDYDQPGDGRSAVAAGPAVRRLGRELGVKLRHVPASGESGRITREDVLKFVRERNEKSAAAQAEKQVGGMPGTPGRDNWGLIRREKMSRLRRTIAANMTTSYTTIPQLTNFDDCDTTDLERMRQTSKADYSSAGIKLTSIPFVVKAVASALKRHPVVNASVDTETNEIIYKQYINIGVAVDTDRGLVVPVLRNVDQMTVPQLVYELAEAIDKTRDGKYSIEDLRGGTFTVSNLGAIGGTYSTPIINPPEVAILLVGRSRTMPVFTEGELEPRLMMPLSITYDHRIVDGAAAARFLNEVKGFLEAPGRLLLAP